jgi:hypothetical protein
MKKITRYYKSFFSLLLIVLLLAFLSGCDSLITGDKPVINSFSANPSTITAGESSTLSWEVTDADSVAITPGVGAVAVSSGTHAVTPATTTTYTLTATNDAGSTTATTTVTVNPPAVTSGSIDVNSTPAGAKVYLDGEDTDFITPIVLTNISAGTHTVKLDKYHYKIKEDTNVLVTAGETTYRNWALTYAPTETKTLQPGSEGEDAYVIKSHPNENRDEDIAVVGIWDSDIRRIYLQFDLSAVPADAVVEDAILKLYEETSIFLGSGDAIVGLYRVTSSWGEDSITWNNQPSSSSEAEDTRTISSTINLWREWDIDDLVRGWLEGSITNYGMLLKATNEASINIEFVVGFRTSDYSEDTSKCPLLRIEYYIP